MSDDTRSWIVGGFFVGLAWFALYVLAGMYDDARTVTKAWFKLKPAGQQRQVGGGPRAQ